MSMLREEHGVQRAGGPRLRVLVVSPSFGGFGGLEAFVLALANGVAIADPSIPIKVLFKRTRGFRLEDSLSERVGESQVPIEFCERASAQLMREIRAADLVHSQNAPPDVVFAARAMRKKLLVSVINHRVARGSIYSQLWKLGLRLAHRRFYISEFVRRSWEGEGVKRGSKVVFPISELATGSVSPAERQGFAFAARWIENKGLEDLLDAYHLAGLDPVRWPLRLMGDGPLRPLVERRVRELGLAGVEILGFVDPDRKAEVLKHSRFVVIPPNTREDFGLVALEARALGVPCIITRDGGLPEAAGAGALVCEPGDVQGLATMLREASELGPEAYEALVARTQVNLDRDIVRPDFYVKAYRDLMPG